jgi:hypothetical protein
LRRIEIAAQCLVFACAERLLRLDLGQPRAQFVALRHRLGELPLQVDVAGLRVFERAQRLRGRFDQPGEESLVVVELEDLELRVDKKVAQRGVCLTHPGFVDGVGCRDILRQILGRSGGLVALGVELSEHPRKPRHESAPDSR